ncbi:MAG: stage II sporulation protein M, partial [Saprospiraceae bacterium]
DELPQLLYNARRELLLSFLIFALGMLIGVLSGAMDSDFAEVILGERYVEMTLENIRSGDPMAVYKESSPFGMSFGITINNLWVAFLTFVMGVFASIGAILILFRNAVMVGVFQYFFIEQDLFIESFLTIWTHGTLEISAIIIAGAAGITLGRGLVFPGTLTRLQAFQRSARRGLKIMIGIVPIIVAAGFIEGYLTRFTETPDVIRLFFILICLAFVLTYYVWYPFKKAKEGFQRALKDTRLPPTANQQIDYSKIKSVGDIFTDIFRFYRRYFSKILKIALATAAFYTATVFVLAQAAPSELFLFPQEFMGTSGMIQQFFKHELIIGLPIINILLYSILAFGIFTFLLKEANQSIGNDFEFQLKNESKTFLQIALLVAIAYGIIWWESGFTYLLLGIAMPILALWAYVTYEEKQFIFTSLSRTFTLLNGQFLSLFGLFLSVTLLALFLFSILDTMVLWFFFEPLTWLFPYDQATLDNLNVMLLTFITMLSLHLLLAIIFVGIGLLYYSLLEVQEATSLLEKVRRIGATRFIKGLERE